MKEGISYSFLLNIIILFIFVCAAIIMGTFSYYKAFRANSIISQTIEKYEGYNCVSADEIARKLDTIGYNLPFKTSCKNDEKNCMTDEQQRYKIIAYNLDNGLTGTGGVNAHKVYENRTDDTRYINMNSTYECNSKGCRTNKHYQFGIYTYMYTELPVISELIRIPLFTKTSILYEFRNFYVVSGYPDKTKKGYVDIEAMYDGLYEKNIEDNKTIYITDTRENQRANDNKYSTGSNRWVSNAIMEYYSTMGTGGSAGQAYQNYLLYITGNSSPDYRTRIITSRLISGRKVDSILGSQIALPERMRICYRLWLSKIKGGIENERCSRERIYTKYSNNIYNYFLYSFNCFNGLQ